jgi:hypothetical protein
MSRSRKRLPRQRGQCGAAAVSGLLLAGGGLVAIIVDSPPGGARFSGW